MSAPSQGLQQFLDSADSILSAIQRGGSYQVSFDPYLSDVHVIPAQAPSMVPWLVAAGLGVIVLLMILGD